MLSPQHYKERSVKQPSVENWKVYPRFIWFRHIHSHSKTHISSLSPAFSRFGLAASRREAIFVEHTLFPPPQFGIVFVVCMCVCACLGVCVLGARKWTHPLLQKRPCVVTCIGMHTLILLCTTNASTMVILWLLKRFLGLFSIRDQSSRATHIFQSSWTVPKWKYYSRISLFHIIRCVVDLLRFSFTTTIITIINIIIIIASPSSYSSVVRLLLLLHPSDVCWFFFSSIFGALEKWYNREWTHKTVAVALADSTATEVSAGKQKRFLRFLVFSRSMQIWT